MVTLAGKHIPGSPFSLHILPSANTIVKPKSDQLFQSLFSTKIGSETKESRQRENLENNIHNIENTTSTSLPQSNIFANSSVPNPNLNINPNTIVNPLPISNNLSTNYNSDSASESGAAGPVVKVGRLERARQRALLAKSMSASTNPGNAPSATTSPNMSAAVTVTNSNVMFNTTTSLKRSDLNSINNTPIPTKHLVTNKSIPNTSPIAVRGINTPGVGSNSKLSQLASRSMQNLNNLKRERAEVDAPPSPPISQTIAPNNLTNSFAETAPTSSNELLAVLKQGLISSVPPDNWYDTILITYCYLFSLLLALQRNRGCGL